MKILYPLLALLAWHSVYRGLNATAPDISALYANGLEQASTLRTLSPEAKQQALQELALLKDGGCSTDCMPALQPIALTYTALLNAGSKTPYEHYATGAAHSIISNAQEAIQK